MFAYCLNNPVNFIDDGGTDAIWIQEKDSAAGFGHSGLMVQDGDGQWWFFYWGPEDENGSVEDMATNGVDARCVLVSVEVNDGDLKTLEGVKKVVGSSDDSFTASRAGIITAGVYFEGDYTATLDYLQKLNRRTTEENTQYHLLTNNCVQQSWTAMGKSNDLFSSSKSPLIPNLTYRTVRRIKKIDTLSKIIKFTPILA